MSKAVQLNFILSILLLLWLWIKWQELEWLASHFDNCSNKFVPRQGHGRDAALFLLNSQIKIHSDPGHLVLRRLDSCCSSRGHFSQVPQPTCQAGTLSRSDPCGNFSLTMYKSARKGPGNACLWRLWSITSYDRNIRYKKCFLSSLFHILPDARSWSQW